MVRLYLLCFVHDRYQRLNDHLISAFCVLLRRYADEVNERARDAFYLHRRQANEDIYQGAKLLYLFIDPDASVWDEARFERLCQTAGSLAEDLFHSGRLESVQIGEELPVAIKTIRELHEFLDGLALLERLENPARVLPMAGHNLIRFRPDGAEGVSIHVDDERAGQTEH